MFTDTLPADSASKTRQFHPVLRQCGMAAVVALPVLLAGCALNPLKKKNKDNGDISAALNITGIEVRGESDTAGAAVSVNSIAQPVSPRGVSFTLNGSTGATDLPNDPGHEQAALECDFRVHVVGGTQDKQVSVIINPVPGDVITAAGTAFATARHLSARTGFGSSWDDLLATMGVDYNTAVDRMVDGARSTPVQIPPDWINATILTYDEYKVMSEAAQKEYNDTKWMRRQKLKEWWLQEIVKTSSPFSERMVMFWSNHFVANIDDVEEPTLAWRWMTLLRTYACGNLKTFIHEMARAASMVIYLDSDSNVKGNPNENFARELMELFTLGEGHVYAEADVPEVARAFTGYSVDARRAWIYNANKHDTAAKTILGQTGAFDGDQTIDIILAAKEGSDTVPRTAVLIVEKLWKEFIGTDPVPATCKALAQILIDNNWELKPLLKAFFKHTAFAAQSNIGMMVKTPVELIGGFYRSLKVIPRDGHWDWRVYDCGSQDQNPLSPPNVKGWLGGDTWINAKTLLERFGDVTNYGGESSDKVPSYLANGFEDFALAIPRVFAATSTINDFPGKIRELLKDPAYQMK